MSFPHTPDFLRIENLRFNNDFAVDIGDIADARKGTTGNDVLTADANVATWLGGGIRTGRGRSSQRRT